MDHPWTEEHRANVAASNRLLKRKFPVGYDCKSRLYRIWKAMRFRCLYPSHKAYPRYGGAGITICAEWRDDYLAFMEWALANGYDETLEIDRKDNGLGYSPDNCRWATRSQQQLNRTDNLPLLSAFGETKTLVAWVADPRCVVSYRRVWNRLLTGIPLEIALSTEHLTPRRKPMAESTKAKIAASHRARV
jgi:hypothetical protein